MIVGFDVGDGERYKRSWKRRFTLLVSLSIRVWKDSS